jgi:hypothetical protein
MGIMQDVLPKESAVGIEMLLKGRDVIYLPLPMFICNTEFDRDAGDIIT